MKVRSSILVGAVVFGLLGLRSASAQTAYKYEALPYAPSTLSNNAIVQNFNIDPVTFAYYPIIYRNNGKQFTVRLPGWYDTVVARITNSGLIVGNVDDSAFTTFGGFIRKPDGNFTTYFHPDAVATFFNDCSEEGTVLGQWTDSSYASHSFLLYRNGRVKDFTVVGFEDVGWSGINDSETLLGSRYNATLQGSQGVLLRHGIPETFVIPGATDTFPSKINNRGSVVGTWYYHSPDYSTSEKHGFVRSHQGRVQNLDYHFANWPASFTDTDGITYAFLHETGTDAYAINERGQVIGDVTALYVGKVVIGSQTYIYVTEQSRGFLATPECDD